MFDLEWCRCLQDPFERTAAEESKDDETKDGEEDDGEHSSDGKGEADSDYEDDDKGDYIDLPRVMHDPTSEYIYLRYFLEGITVHAFHHSEQIIIVNSRLHVQVLGINDYRLTAHLHSFVDFFIAAASVKGSDDSEEEKDSEDEEESEESEESDDSGPKKKKARKVTRKIDDKTIKVS